MPKPNQFSANRFAERSAAGSPRLLNPMSRKSTAMLVPIQIDKPEKWISWTKGYPQRVSRTHPPQGVLSSNLPKAISKLDIGVLFGRTIRVQSEGRALLPPEWRLPTAPA